ncbi:MAG: GNAT family N-acetyltransferase [Candidatus Rokubacteria bacterium]|nr:GNAT family N-acetyltransferase [Candidatus Rokubacteria bacterium]
MSRSALTIRSLEPPDLEALIRIDERLTGQTRKEYWAKRLELSALRPPWMSLVAELDNRVAGFLFGWTTESEFGIPVPTGWIDLIGVDPPYRGRGVAQALVERFLAAGRELRAIEKVITLIDLARTDVREFFLKAGFRHGPLIQLEREV